MPSSTSPALELERPRQITRFIVSEKNRTHPSPNTELTPLGCGLREANIAGLSAV